MSFDNGESAKKFFEDEANNLLMNLSGRLLPEDLSEREVDLLKNRFGDNWFNELGYYEPEYKRPQY